MIQFYQIKENGIFKTTEEHFNWLVIDDEVESEIQQICSKYKLPRDLFVDAEFTEGTARFEWLNETELTNTQSIILLHLNEQATFIENQIEPISFVLSDELMITYHAKDNKLIEQWINSVKPPLLSFEQIFTDFVVKIYIHFITTLKEIKNTIDQLNKSARQTAKNKELINLSDTERSLIFLYHLLHDQNEVLIKLWKNQAFNEKVNNRELINDAKHAQKQTLKLVDVYRDLLVSISSLFSSLIDNNLNHLMKFLESLEVLLAFPALIAGIWGMNTGGLPGEKSNQGFWLVLGISFIFTVLVGAFLRRKSYDK